MNHTNITATWFRVLILEQNLEARYDFLTMGVGSEVVESNTVVKLTHNTFPNSVHITGPAMWVTFTTDGSGTRSGFSLQVAVVSSNGTGKHVS